jgi:hypothetical protein
MDAAIFLIHRLDRISGQYSERPLFRHRRGSPAPLFLSLLRIIMGVVIDTA